MNDEPTSVEKSLKKYAETLERQRSEYLKANTPPEMSVEVASVTPGGTVVQQVQEDDCTNVVTEDPFNMNDPRTPWPTSLPVDKLQISTEAIKVSVGPDLPEVKVGDPVSFYGPAGKKDGTIIYLGQTGKDPVTGMDFIHADVMLNESLPARPKVPPAGAYEAKYGWIQSTVKKFHPNEPIFILRATDPLASLAVALYAQLCQSTGCDLTHVADTHKQASRIKAWQEENPTLVKPYPD